MEGKELGILKLRQEPGVTSGFQRAADSIPSVKVAVPKQEPVVVSLENVPADTGSGDLRQRFNEIINVVNVTSEATNSIRKLVDSIDGIVKQVSESEPPANRVPVLEHEANGLIQEIKRIASETSVGGLRPLAGDKVLLEVREQLGKTLEIIFPDEAKDAFGLGQIGLSRKEFIIETKAKLTAAWVHIEELNKAVAESTSAVKETVSSLEVAMQNSQAAESSPRDLEQAMRLADETSLGISKNPDRALKSVGPIAGTALQLLG